MRTNPKQPTTVIEQEIGKALVESCGKGDEHLLQYHTRSARTIKGATVDDLIADAHISTRMGGAQSILHHLKDE